jgi:hypothetical protein
VAYFQVLLFGLPSNPENQHLSHNFYKPQHCNLNLAILKNFTPWTNIVNDEGTWYFEKLNQWRKGDIC